MIYLPLFGEYLAANISLADADGPYAFNLSQPIINLFEIPTLLATPTISGPGFGGGAPVVEDDISTVPSTAFLGFRTTQESQSIAGFAQATYHLTERLRLTGGLRYTSRRERRYAHIPLELACRAWRLGVAVPRGRSQEALGCAHRRRKHRLRFAERTLIYAKYSRGYKAGGFNPGECTGDFDPEYLSSYEVGIKSIFGDGQFAINAAAFY